MPFVKIPGCKGQVYVPAAGETVKRKYPCKDCYFCQLCPLAKCRKCRAAKAVGATKTSTSAHSLDNALQEKLGSDTGQHSCARPASSAANSGMGSEA